MNEIQDSQSEKTISKDNEQKCKKIALCFIISGKHILNKENLWINWIESIKNYINVYFFYSNYSKIGSSWIKSHCIPKKFTIPSVTYLHMIPAYINLIQFAIMHDPDNQWFCFLTDSCTPIIQPSKFLQLFEENNNKTIMGWIPAEWNIYMHRRANLHLLSKKYHLKNSPYFILCKQHASLFLRFVKTKPTIYNIISGGIIANESLFAIILKFYGQLENDTVINETSTLTDWTRMSSSTSPYLFRVANPYNIQLILSERKINKYTTFLRKVSTDFSDDILKNLIYCTD